MRYHYKIIFLTKSKKKSVSSIGVLLEKAVVLNKKIKFKLYLLKLKNNIKLYFLLHKIFNL